MQLYIKRLSILLLLSLRHVTSIKWTEEEDTSSQKYLRMSESLQLPPGKSYSHRQLKKEKKDKKKNDNKKKNSIFKWMFNFEDNTKPAVTENKDSNDVVPEVETNNTINDKQRALKTIYILRHAEHNRECNVDKTQCTEWLRPKGIRRVDRLVNYMKENDIINDVTHVFATHLYRTSLTVLPIAELADVSVTTFPKDAEYSVDVVESVCPTLQAVKSTPTNSTIIISGHGRTIYQILSSGVNTKCNGLGLDTSNNQMIFPKDEDGTLPEDDIGFSNLWKVSIIDETIDVDENESVVKLDEHVLI